MEILRKKNYKFEIAHRSVKHDEISHELLHPTQRVNHPFVQGIHAVHLLPIRHWVMSQLSNQLLQYHSACVQVNLYLLNNIPRM